MPGRVRAPRNQTADKPVLRLSAVSNFRRRAAWVSSFGPLLQGTKSSTAHSSPGSIVPIEGSVQDVGCRIPESRGVLAARGWCGQCETAPEAKASGAVSMRCRRWPTLPRSLDRSTIGAVGLNDRVRDGNGCGPYALIACYLVRQAASRLTEGVRVNGQEDVCGRCVISAAVLTHAVVCSHGSSLRRYAPSLGMLTLELLEVVKPHGRLGPLRSERLATCPRRQPIDGAVVFPGAPRKG